MIKWNFKNKFKV